MHIRSIDRHDAARFAQTLLFAAGFGELSFEIGLGCGDFSVGGVPSGRGRAIGVNTCGPLVKIGSSHNLSNQLPLLAAYVTVLSSGCKLTVGST